MKLWAARVRVQSRIQSEAANASLRPTKPEQEPGQRSFNRIMQIGGASRMGVRTGVGLGEGNIKTARNADIGDLDILRNGRESELVPEELCHDLLGVRGSLLVACVSRGG